MLRERAVCKSPSGAMALSMRAISLLMLHLRHAQSQAPRLSITTAVLHIDNFMSEALAYHHFVSLAALGDRHTCSGSVSKLVSLLPINIPGRLHHITECKEINNQTSSRLFLSCSSFVHLKQYVYLGVQIPVLIQRIPPSDIYLFVIRSCRMAI
jgi:hypothetical protein